METPSAANSAGASPLPRTCICTAVWGDFGFGLAGLVNGLARSRFRGDLVVACAGGVPSWCRGQRLGDVFEPARGIRLHLMETSESARSCAYRCRFLAETWARFAPEQIFWMDADVVPDAAWVRFAEWAPCGVALAEDPVSPLYENDPYRVHWREVLCRPLGLHARFRGPEYANSGFAGFDARTMGLVDLWARVCDRAEALADSVRRLPTRALTPAQDLTRRAVRFLDQDALNAALECEPHVPVSFRPPCAMGFRPGPRLMRHAIGPRKPWNQNFLREAVRGYPPRAVDAHYWRLMRAGPVRPFTRGQILYRRLQIGLARAASGVLPRVDWYC